MAEEEREFNTLEEGKYQKKEERKEGLIKDKMITKMKRNKRTRRIRKSEQQIVKQKKKKTKKKQSLEIDSKNLSSE